MDTEKMYTKKSSVCLCWSASAGRAGVGFLSCIFVVFLVGCCELSFISPKVSFLILPKHFPNFLISPSPSNLSMCRSISDFSIHQLKCSSPSHTHPHKAIAFCHRPEKAICRAVPKGTPLFSHHSWNFVPYPDMITLKHCQQFPMTDQSILLRVPENGFKPCFFHIYK